MKPPPPGSRAGADRWMVSYADLVTLLFAFFATLYAASSLDATKIAPVATSLREAFAMSPGTGEARTGAAVVSPVAVLPRTSIDEDLHRRLARELADAIAQHRLELIRDPRGLVVSLPDDATFPTGSADATLEARMLIAKVGDVLRSTPNAIRIEGHTDDVPIRTARYASNWELSTARASAVVAFLVSTVGIEAGRLSAAGYGEFHPRGPNDSGANRARNRRVDLVILDSHDPRERPTPSAGPPPTSRPDVDGGPSLGEVDAEP